MSWEATTHVTRASRQKGAALLTLLMLANHAHADGTNARPAVDTLAQETRLTRRHVQRILRALEAAGEIRNDGLYGRGGRAVANYTIVGVPNGEPPAPPQPPRPGPRDGSGGMRPIGAAAAAFADRARRGRRP